MAKVDFTVPENRVRAECLEGCGFVTEADSAVDAFTNWWDHKVEVHPEGIPEPEPTPGPEIPPGLPDRPIYD